MKVEFKIAAPCGLICDECPWYKGEKEQNCPGCLAKKGKPFWGECEVYQCSDMKKIEHCGSCSEFPCETIINHYDPNNPKGAQEAIFRIGQLTIRASIGTKSWLERRSDGSLTNFQED